MAKLVNAVDLKSWFPCPKLYHNLTARIWKLPLYVVSSHRLVFLLTNLVSKMLATAESLEHLRPRLRAPQGSSSHGGLTNVGDLMNGVQEVVGSNPAARPDTIFAPFPRRRP